MSKEFLLKMMPWLHDQSPLVFAVEALSTQGCLEATSNDWLGWTGMDSWVLPELWARPFAESFMETSLPKLHLTFM